MGLVGLGVLSIQSTVVTENTDQDRQIEKLILESVIQEYNLVYSLGIPIIITYITYTYTKTFSDSSNIIKDCQSRSSDVSMFSSLACSVENGLLQTINKYPTPLQY